MPTLQPIIHTADLTNPSDARDYREQLAAYASDPMGGGVSLPHHRLQRAVLDLKQMPHARLFLARLDGTAVGFATCFSAYSTFRARPLWNIHDVAVIASHRRQGIGQALIEHVGQAAKAEGCCKLTLEVREDNPLAHGLYQKLGFTAAQIQERQVQYLFLEKPLPPG